MLNHQHACHYLSVSSHPLGCTHYTNPFIVFCPTTKIGSRNKAIGGKPCVPLKFKYVSANIALYAWGNHGLNIVLQRKISWQFCVGCTVRDLQPGIQNSPPAGSQAVAPTCRGFGPKMMPVTQFALGLAAAAQRAELAAHR